ncbi:MAG: ferredoxin-type protein NapG [Sulfurimonas sp.]|jgi:ferredoxin-type protein NapG|uniref:ferredoxin-type protein NapG n=1 Tax=unclassified Sulfurimonas TaxID=2623549 RepID=UPI0008C1F880|nr:MULTISPECIES: ferredoxin-type protein NapG [unclassified Sulfurimonas]OHE11972.1 MAG: ferredoxin-type protein NapG [Sulfurimonas sp. RIFOXYC2_FULL_36_7]MBS4067588.1 ferredoxin-type protein NapG [Sulfurimonas sp.]MDD3854214.1 ferredoxin-type protein NapG [Sulfurimonas sp.]MDX9757405.1 ferredoxin-type protein NapG [Sulfurimonas sp.]OHE04497.1 MAG: ferredoxin-type protein NapG [Sulfurimonas sp. RIFOXYB12_FULL_35_9]
MKNETQSDRRKFILSMARGAGITALSGFIWSAYVDEVTASQLLLRPPGAIKEEDFLKTCIKCGLCVEACPYNTLLLAKPGDNKPLGTPYFIPRDIPCYMCPDIPCVPVCPTGALNEPSVTTKGKLDINIADMGLAVIDRETCIAFWGIQCDACYRACPILGHAITVEYHKNERTGKHAYLTPVVHADACTGCGLCEKACVTEKASIFILPREVAMGKAGNYYIKGWDKEDEKRLKDASEIKTTTEISKGTAIDSLNSGIGGLDK